MYEIFNRTAAPYRTVCFITSEWSDGSMSRGSGVVVGVNDVLTAAHVVYNASRGGFATSVTITPAADLDSWGSVVSQPYGEYSGSYLDLRVQNWDSDGDGLLTQQEAQHDLALIGLGADIGNDTGWSGWWATASDFSGMMVGYPATESGMMAANVYADASASYGVFEINDRLGAGASGGPLFYTDSNGSYVVGVLSSGNNFSSTYAGLFGPGNLAWFEAALAENDYLMGGGTGGGGVTDDYAASTSTTGRISVGGSVAGTIGTYDDLDWFRLEISSAGTYSFDLVGGSLEDPYLRVHGASGALLYENDDIELAVQRDSHLTLSLGAGTYYVSAGSYHDLSINDIPTLGSYTLTVQRPGSFLGTPASDILTGTTAGESLWGLGGSDTLIGSGGNDFLDGGPGNDIIDGGEGLDHAVFTSAKNLYTVTRTATGLTVRGPDGTDVLSDVERLQFSDYYLAFDTTGTAGQAYRLYQAAFDRQPDLAGLGHQINALDTSLTLLQVAQNFLNSPEFSRTYGGLDDMQFATQLYLNVLHRTPDAGGLAHQVDALAHGLARSQLLMNFSESPENQAAVIGAIQGGITYLL